MNKKLLMFTLIPLVLSVMVAPVMGIGPQKAEKNPNAMFPPHGVQLPLPSGVFNEWMADRESPIDRVHILNASKFKIRNAFPLTDPATLLLLENKWVYISQTVFVDLLMSFGYPRIEAEAIAAMYPDGIYFMFVNVGK